MARIPTDREILRCIYNLYLEAYPAKGKVLIPIDMQRVAAELGMTVDMLHGRLYFDMGTRLRHRDPKDSRVTLASVYEPVAGEQHHVVNFPYLTALLASLEDERAQSLWTRRLSVIAIVVAVLSAGTQVLVEFIGNPG